MAEAAGLHVALGTVDLRLCGLLQARASFPFSMKPSFALLLQLQHLAHTTTREQRRLSRLSRLSLTQKVLEALVYSSDMDSLAETALPICNMVYTLALVTHAASSWSKGHTPCSAALDVLWTANECPARSQPNKKISFQILGGKLQVSLTSQLFLILPAGPIQPLS